MNANDIEENTKKKLGYYLLDLKEITVNKYKIKKIDFAEGVITFEKVESPESPEYNIKLEYFNDKLGMPNGSNVYDVNNSETSELKTDQINPNELSVTSDIPVTGQNQQPQPQPQPQSNQTGGNNKNIFKSSKYSDTSSVRFNKLSNYSITSSVMYNDRSDNFSDTSVIGQIGGGLETTDTLRSISELKDRKNKSSNKNLSASTSTFKSNLDMDIFKKSKNQSGGSKSNSDLKKKMLEAGINSSSTSSLCE
jgi:hypothetical protein